MNYNMFDEIDYFTNILSNNNNNNDEVQNNNTNSNLYSPYEGYLRGNLFKNLYNQYKNYRPYKVPVNNERDEMLLNIGQLSFARHELNLLLDNYPNNREALNLFNRYLEMENNERKNYERRFGPLEVTSQDTSIPFKWEADLWPWEM